MSVQREVLGPCIDCVYFEKDFTRWEWERAGRCFRYPTPVERTSAMRLGCGEFVRKEETP